MRTATIDSTAEMKTDSRSRGTTVSLYPSRASRRLRVEDRLMLGRGGDDVVPRAPFDPTTPLERQVISIGPSRRETDLPAAPPRSGGPPEPAPRSTASARSSQPKRRDGARQRSP